MDQYYSPIDLYHLQTEFLLMGLGVMLILGLAVKDRRLWLLLTLVVWGILGLFYAANAPSGIPYPT
ncbi:MAG: hypothetical protein ABF719_12550 [Acetobacter sp.]|uniref:hypothetical protein n=1 Tax=Acetobacter sp. TaxID=440 RepID=UPI0039ED3647